MKKIIIRDDDTSFYTSPDLLERVYAPLWEHNHPVCLAVVPAANGNVIVEHRPGKPFDPAIPPIYRGVENNHSILNNPTICQFLNEKAKHGLVEICLHGYSHAYMEYTTTDGHLLKEKLKKGMDILTQAFPDATITTFVAPYDHLSPIAFETLVDFDFNICTNSKNLDPFPQYKHMGNYDQTTLPSGKTLSTCDGYLFTHRISPEESLDNTHQRLTDDISPLIITNHYWTFFYDWAAPNNTMLEAWYQVITDIHTRPDVEITTFNKA